MATCIDCIHQYCCKYDRFFGIDDVENKCNYFKNKADVIQVVRCKDCLFYEEVEYYHPTENATKKVCRLIQRQMHENDFCSYGKKEVIR